MRTASASETVAASPTAGSASRSGFRLDVQGVRGIAVLLVVLYHADVEALSGGFIGVDVFFVLSGFVITAMVVRDRRAAGRVSFRDFYARRVRRLLPALALLTSIVMVASLLFGPIASLSRTIGTGVAATLFSANLYLISIGKGGYFNAPAETNPLLHTWSLSLEEQFYLIFPVLLAVLLATGGRFRHPARVVAVGVAAVAAASFALCVGATYDLLPTARLDQDTAFFLAPTRAWQFAVGALLAIVAGRIRLPRAVASIAGWAGVALVLIAATAFSADTRYPGVAALVPTLGAALILAGGIGGVGSTSRALAWRPLTWLGDLSYAWYLWHWPLIVFTKAMWPGDHALVVLVALASLAPAVASYRWVEQPARLRPRTHSQSLRLAATCIAVPLVVAAVVVVAGRGLARTSAVAAFDEQVALHIGAENGCQASLAELPNPQCTFPAGEVPEEGSGFLLVGDSNAEQFSELAVDAAEARGTTATIQTRGVCPFLDLELRRDGRVDEGCARFVDAMTEEILDARPEVVILSNAADAYVNGRDIALGEGGRWTTPEEKAAAWEDAMAARVEQFEAAGIDVVVMQPIPKFPEWSPQECATARILVDVESCGTEEATAALAEANAPAAEAQRRAVGDGSDQVQLVEVFDVLCPEERCSPWREDGWWWRDGGHVSIAGARALSDRFDAALDQLGV